MPEGRVCSKCKMYKEAEYFGTHKGKLRSQCKACEKEYYEANKDKISERTKADRKANPEKYQEKSRKWYEKHKESKNAYGKQYYQDNKEASDLRNKANYEKNKDQYKIAFDIWYEKNRDRQLWLGRKRYKEKKEEIDKYTREWNKRNPHKVRATLHRRRAKERNAEGFFTDKDIEVMLVNQQGTCFYCPTDISTKYEIEHQLPVSRGGSNWPENLVLACRSCNASKHDKTHEEFIAWRKKQQRFEMHELLFNWR